MGLYRHSDGFDYREVALSNNWTMGINPVRPKWRGYYADSYTPRLKEILHEVLGDAQDDDYPDMKPTQLTLHPRFWCGKSLLPFNRCSGRVKKLLTAKGIMGYAPTLSGEIENQLKYWKYHAVRGKATTSMTRKVFSNITHILRRYLHVMAAVNSQKVLGRVITLKESQESLVWRWRSVEQSVNNGDFIGTAPSAHHFWYEGRNRLKPILLVQKELRGMYKFLSPSRREMFHSYYECPESHVIPEFDKYDPQHKGLALAEVDEMTRAAIEFSQSIGE